MDGLGLAVEGLGFEI